MRGMRATILSLCLLVWSCSESTSPASADLADCEGSNQCTGVETVEDGEPSHDVWRFPEPVGQPPKALDWGRWNPQFYRDSEVDLSGEWFFAFDPDGTGEERGVQRPPFGEAAYPERIEVPYPWQSLLSGVGPEVPGTWAKFGSEREVNSYRGDVWYARMVEVPANLGSDERWVLRLGAVDWRARVFVEGELAGEHEGGYTPMEVDLTRFAEGKSEIGVAVQVTDVCDDDPAVLVGKQGTTWYTCSGGIWQEPTLLRRPAVHLAGMVGRMADGQEMAVDVAVSSDWDETGKVPGETRVRVVAQCLPGCEAECGPIVGEALVEEGEAHVVLDVADVPVWSPSTPCLLSTVVELGGPGVSDVAYGYVARRNLEIAYFPGHSPQQQSDPQQQFKAIFSDGKPVYLRSVLDQGYHPEGIFQYPSKEARRGDLATVKELGFNGIRQHIKPEAPWFYAMADELGLWVVYDFPSPASEVASGADAAWRGPFERTLEELVSRDAGHPSLLWWVLFNEAWGVAKPPYWGEVEGRAYVTGLVNKVRALDPGRPVEDHSPGGLSDFLSMGQFPHVESDLLSFHLYASDVTWMAKRVQAVVESFFPGSLQHFFGGRVQAGEPLFNSEFGGLAADDTRGDGTYLLHAWLNQLHRYSKVQGYVFTQAYDVEWEKNGLMTYDRMLKEFGLDELGLTMADLSGDPYLVLGPDPIMESTPGSGVAVELGLSSSLPMTVGSFVVEVRTREGEILASQTVAGGDYLGGYTLVKSVEVQAPSEVGVYVVYAEAKGATVACRNALYLVVDQPVVPEEGEISEANVLAPVACVTDGACMCEGWCDLDIEVATPGPGLYRLVFEGELASYDPVFPQTDALLRMSSLEIRVDDEAVKGALTSDCPADHRGVLSLLRHFDQLRGAYGVWSSHDLGIVSVGDRVKLTFRSHDNGVTLFLRGGGRTLRAPRLRFLSE